MEKVDISLASISTGVKEVTSVVVNDRLESAVYVGLYSCPVVGIAMKILECFDRVNELLDIQDDLKIDPRSFFSIKAEVLENARIKTRRHQANDLLYVLACTVSFYAFFALMGVVSFEAALMVSAPLSVVSLGKGVYEEYVHQKMATVAAKC